MKKVESPLPADWEPAPEYDFAGAERGRHHRGYRSGIRTVVDDNHAPESAGEREDPDIAPKAAVSKTKRGASDD